MKKPLQAAGIVAGRSVAGSFGITVPLIRKQTRCPIQRCGKLTGSGTNTNMGFTRICKNLTEITRILSV